MRNKFVILAGMALCWAPSALAETGQPQSVQPQPVSQTGTTNDDASRMAAVQQHVEAYRSGDLDRFVATFTPDAVVRADGFVAMGHEQIRAMFELNFLPGSPSLRVHDSGIKGDTVYLNAGYVTQDGRELCCSYSEYEITDGKISFLRTGS